MKQKKKFYLMGGFGNLLFQAQVIIALAEKETVILNTFLIEKNFVTKFLKFKIHEDLSIFIFNNVDNVVFRRSFIIREILDIVILNLSKKLQREIMGYQWVSIDYAERCNVFAGYCQSERIFNKTLKEKVLLKSNLLSQLSIPKTNNVVVHYRGTNSVLRKKYSNYYNLVFRVMKADYTEFVIVTDDRQMLEANFKFQSNIEIFDGRTTIEDFATLCFAEILIVGPSTFSWWAAVVNSDAKKIYLPRMINDELPIIESKIVEYI